MVGDSSFTDRITSLLGLDSGQVRAYRYYHVKRDDFDSKLNLLQASPGITSPRRKILHPTESAARHLT